MTYVSFDTEPALTRDMMDRDAFEGVFILERFGLPGCQFQRIASLSRDSWFVYRLNDHQALDTIGIGDTATEALIDAIQRHGEVLDLAAIRNRRQAANPGPWWTATNTDDDWEENVIRGPAPNWHGTTVQSSHELGALYHRKDEAFVTQASIDVAVLLIEIGRLRDMMKKQEA